jgi:hypothetical protein
MECKTNIQLLDEKKEFDNYMKDNNLKEFLVTTVTIYDFVEGVKRGLYDLNPPHQRDVVHNSKWMSGIVDSIIKGRPLGNPEFDTVKDQVTGRKKKRSLDGKQRCSALVQLKGDNYIYKGKIKALYGKIFSDWPIIWKNYFDDRKFTIASTEETLNNNEVTEHFKLKQETKKTSTGETLNAMRTGRVQLIRNMLDGLSYGDDKMVDRRKNKFEILVRLIYLLEKYKEGLNIDPKKSTLENFLKKTNELDENNFVKHEIFINNLFVIVKNIEHNYKWRKTFLLPLSCLMIDVDNNEKIIDFLNSEVNGKEIYNTVGGSHNASCERATFIKNKFNTWNN